MLRGLSAGVSNSIYGRHVDGDSRWRAPAQTPDGLGWPTKAVRLVTIPVHPRPETVKSAAIAAFVGDGGGADSAGPDPGAGSRSRIPELPSAGPQMARV